MKIGLIGSLCLATLLFYGCGTVSPTPPVVFNTFNTSSNKAPAKQKSTATYPGSSQQSVVTPKTPTAPTTSTPLQPEAKAPVIDNTLTSSEITSKPAEKIEAPVTPPTSEQAVVARSSLQFRPL